MKDNKFQASDLAFWYGEITPEIYPKLSDNNDELWYDDLVSKFEKMPALLVAIDKEIKSLSLPKKTKEKQQDLYIAISAGEDGPTTYAFGVFKTKQQAVRYVFIHLKRKRLLENFFKENEDLKTDKDAIELILEEGFQAFDLAYEVESESLFDFTDWTDWDSKNLGKLQNMLENRETGIIKR